MDNIKAIILQYCDNIQEEVLHNNNGDEIGLYETLLKMTAETTAMVIAENEQLNKMVQELKDIEKILSVELEQRTNDGIHSLSERSIEVKAMLGLIQAILEKHAFTN